LTNNSARTVTLRVGWQTNLAAAGVGSDKQGVGIENHDQVLFDKCARDKLSHGTPAAQIELSVGIVMLGMVWLYDLCVVDRSRYDIQKEAQSDRWGLRTDSYPVLQLEWQR